MIDFDDYPSVQGLDMAQYRIATLRDHLRTVLRSLKASGRKQAL